jgi:hypothetical protein
LSALFMLFILKIGPHFISRPAWTAILLFVFPRVAGMIGTPLCPVISCDGVLWRFYLDHPRAAILLIYTSWGARIIGLNHGTWAVLTFFKPEIQTHYSL